MREGGRGRERERRRKVGKERWGKKGEGETPEEKRPYTNTVSVWL